MTERPLFQREPLDAALWDEAMPLLRAHWREIAHYQDIPLDPDPSVYAASEAAGMLRCFTARHTTGMLAGYALFFVRPNPHYRASVQAVQDVIYLDPSVRGGTGAAFIAWCDQQLAQEGVQAVYHHVKAAHNFGPLLERLGYTLVDHLYARRLDHGRDSRRRLRGRDGRLDGVRGDAEAPEDAGRAGGSATASGGAALDGSAGGATRAAAPEDTGAGALGRGRHAPDGPARRDGAGPGIARAEDAAGAVTDLTAFGDALAAVDPAFAGALE